MPITSNKIQVEGKIKTITQTAHGFVVGDWVYLSNTVYTKTDADLAISSDSVGVVTSVIDSNTFNITTEGFVTGFGGLIAGTRYYLSTVAGAITPTLPTNNIKAVFIADSAISGYVQQYAVGASSLALTYGRVRANLDLASTTYINTDPGTKIPFTISTYLSGMTDNAGSLIPTVSGRYRADWLCMSASTEFLADGIFFVVQNGVSVGQVSYNMNEASAVNQSAGFIDVDLVAGQEVSLHYRTRHATTDGISWDRGSYFQLTQLPTAVAPVVNTVAEYGEQVLGSGVTVPTTSTSPTVATDIMSFTLPSAGTWDVDFIVRGATFSVSTSGANGMAAVITDNLNNVITNTELKVGRESLASVDAINLDLQFSATGKAQIVTTSATTYKVRGYHDGSGGSTGSWTAQSDNNGRTKVSWTKIAGQLPAIMPTTVSGGIAFGNGTQLVQDTSNLFYDDVNNRLGIGTNTPTAKTQIVSTTTANATGEPLLKLSSNYGAGLLPGAGGSLIFTDEVNTSVGEIRSLTQNPNNVELSFSTFGGGVLSEKLRISPTGNLGVGVTNPVNKLHIGTASVANTGGIRLPINSASADQTGSAIGVNADGDIVKISSVITTVTRVNVICRNKTTQLMTNTAWTKNTNWTEIQDPTNSFDPVTGVFTAPRTASYAFDTSNRTPTVSDGGEYAQGVFLNNTTLLYGGWGRAYLSTTFSAHTSGVINMNAGDTLDARTLFEGAANGNDTPTADYSWFTITEINPTF